MTRLDELNIYSQVADWMRHGYKLHRTAVVDAMQAEIDFLRAQLAEKDKVIEGLKAEKIDLLERHRQNITAYDAAISGPHEYWGHVAALLAVTSYDALYDYGVNERPSEQAETLGHILDGLRIDLAKAKGELLKSGKEIEGLREDAKAQAVKLEDRIEALIWLLGQIINDLPQQRDWLDPNIEQKARALLNATPNTDGTK